MKNYKKIVLTGVLALLTNLIFAQNNDPKNILIDELKDHIKILASEKFEGRKPGAPGGEISAEYIREQLKLNNIQLLGVDGFQYLELTTSLTFGKNNKLSYNDKNFVLAKDFYPSALSSDKNLTASAVFAGYGFDIKDQNVNWNDYETITAKDKWVIVFTGGPDDREGKFDSYTSTRKKALLAKEKGAAGVIFVDQANTTYDKKIEQVLGRSVMSIGIPVIQITITVFDILIKEKDLTTAELAEHFDKEKAPYSFELKNPISASTEIVENKAKTANIIGIVEGSDPVLKNEFVVIGAHYDHLGWGGPNSGSRVPDTSAIHYGADDNASGVATILEIIEKLKAESSDLKRSVVFVAFAAEEMGLLGSKFFTTEPLIDLSKVNIMLNFDMVGRMDPVKKAFTLGGTGTAEGLEDFVKNFASSKNVSIGTSSAGFGPSDHASFYTKNIPVLFLFTDLHTDYHTPADTPDKINYEGQKTISDFSFDLIKHFANSDQKLVYKESGPKNPDQGASRSFKVSLGIMPDMASQNNDGLGVDGVTPEKPAAKAGIKKGDKIISLNGKEIKNIYEYMDSLNELKKGNQYKVIVLRNGEKVELTIVL